jgi:hypothetical protein
MNTPKPDQRGPAAAGSSPSTGSAIARDMIQLDWLAMHRENQRLIGIIRNLREIVWNHHSSTVMLPDVCPVCTDPKIKWALDIADAAISPNAEVSDSRR